MSTLVYGNSSHFFGTESLRTLSTADALLYNKLIFISIYLVTDIEISWIHVNVYKLLGVLREYDVSIQLYLSAIRLTTITVSFYVMDWFSFTRTTNEYSLSVCLTTLFLQPQSTIANSIIYYIHMTPLDFIGVGPNWFPGCYWGYIWMGVDHLGVSTQNVV